MAQQPRGQPHTHSPPDQGKAAAAAKRKRKRGRGDRRSCDGILKIAIRFVDHRLDGPWTTFSNASYAKDFDRSLDQLIRLVDKPKFKGKVAWAAIYDCTNSRYGPEICTWKGGEWHYIVATGR